MRSRSAYRTYLVCSDPVRLEERCKVTRLTRLLTDREAVHATADRQLEWFASPSVCHQLQLLAMVDRVSTAASSICAVAVIIAAVGRQHAVEAVLAAVVGRHRNNAGSGMQFQPGCCDEVPSIRPPAMTKTTNLQGRRVALTPHARACLPLNYCVLAVGAELHLALLDTGLDEALDVTPRQLQPNMSARRLYPTAPEL